LSQENQHEDRLLPSKDELIGILEDMCKNIEALPPGAALAPVTHMDFAALIMLIAAIFRKS